MKRIELKTISDPILIFELIEARLKKLFRKLIYYPLLSQLELPNKTIQNTAHPNPVMDALYRLQIQYENGIFFGKFNAAISKELRNMGAKFDRKMAIYRFPESELTVEMKNVIASSKVKFLEKMSKINDKLSKIVPEEIVKHFNCEDLFDRALIRADTEFRDNVKNIAVLPKITEEQRKTITKEWQENMDLWIKDWTEEQIKDLRKRIYQNVISGERRASHIPSIFKITQTIQESHDQAMNKAKFLARQETRLLMAKFKEVRYRSAGSESYIWGCIHQPKDTSPDHHVPGNVRYSHGILDKKEFRWDSPPVTTNPGEPERRNNPGQDYNCRCFSRPVLKITSKTFQQS